MGIVIVRGKPSLEQLKQARKDYESYIKITIDIRRERVALGGEYERWLKAKGYLGRGC